MEFTEKDLENHIIINEHLSEEYGIDIIAQQFRTEFGVIDLLGYDAENKQLVVVELKKGIVDENAVGQIMRYLSTIQDLIEGYNCLIDTPGHLAKGEKPYGILIGTDATDAVKTITRNFPFLKFVKAEVTMEIKTDMITYSRVEDSLAKDIKYYENSGALEKIEDIYQNQIATENWEAEEDAKLQREREAAENNEQAE